MARISSSASGPGAAAPLPTLIHGRVRLLVLSRLMSRPGGYAFTELRDMLQLTDGSLSVHLAKLEAGRLVEIRKDFVGRKPRTLVRMTASGRQRFRDYVADLRRIVPGLEPME